MPVKKSTHLVENAKKETIVSDVSKKSTKTIAVKNKKMLTILVLCAVVLLTGVFFSVWRYTKENSDFSCAGYIEDAAKTIAAGNAQDLEKMVQNIKDNNGSKDINCQYIVLKYEVAKGNDVAAQLAIANINALLSEGQSLSSEFSGGVADVQNIDSSLQVKKAEQDEYQGGIESQGDYQDE